VLWTILAMFLGCATDGETGAGIDILSDGGTCDCPKKGPCSWSGTAHDGIPLVAVTFGDGTVRPAPTWSILSSGEIKVDCGLEDGLAVSVRWVP
jgi:hypothetical protein